VLSQILCSGILLLSCSRGVHKESLRVANELRVSQTTAWTVDFHLSGGLAGADRVLTISSSGDFSAEDRRQPSRVTAKVTTAQLDQITPLVLRSKATPESRHGDSRCRDCLSYNLTIQIGGERFTARLDDTTLPDSGLEELARVLAGLLNRALPAK
jgi:hypothetical protein